MSLEKIEEIKKVGETLKSVEEPLERIPADKEHFQALMDKGQEDLKTAASNESQHLGVSTDEAKKSSFMDEVSKANSQVQKLEEISPEALKKQTAEALAQMDQVKAQLSDPSSTIKPSYQTVLQNRLNHIEDQLKIAVSKMSSETGTPTAGIDPAQHKITAIDQGNAKNPIERFLGFVSHGQYQLENLEKMIDNLQGTGKSMTPANMLAIQIKVGYVQQEIELFTSLLNKALESTKTIMNVQV